MTGSYPSVAQPHTDCYPPAEWLTPGASISRWNPYEGRDFRAHV